MKYNNFAYYNSFQSSSFAYCCHIFYTYMHYKPHNAMVTFLNHELSFKEIKRKNCILPIYTILMLFIPSWKFNFYLFSCSFNLKAYFSISYNVHLLATDYLCFNLQENFNQLIKILNQFAHTPLKNNCPLWKKHLFPTKYP